MHLNFAKFKKIKEDKDKATFQHENGHTMEVSIAALSPKLRKMLANIPVHMADGGEVKSKSQERPKDEQAKKNAEDMSRGATQSGWQPQKWMDNAKKAVGMYEGGAVNKINPDDYDTPEQYAAAFTAFNPGTTEGQAFGERAIQIGEDKAKDTLLPGENFADQRARLSAAPTIDLGSPEPAIAAVETPVAPTPLAPPTEAPVGQMAAPTAPGAPPAMPSAQQPNMLQQGLEHQKQGLLAEAKALQQQALKETMVLEKSAADQQRAGEVFKTKYAQLEQARSEAMKAFSESKVDPNRYYSSMDTGGKISSAIGLILGGIGSGVTGGKNPAMEFINDQINRDIDAQKSELGTKKNLLDANMQQFQDLRMATEMTRIQMTDLASTQLKLAAAKSQDPLVKARSIQAIGKLEADNAAALTKMANQSTLSSLEAAVKTDPSKANMYLDVMSKVDPKAAQELRGRLVPGMGFANTDKDASDMKEVITSVKQAKSGITELRRIMEVPFKSLRPKERGEAQLAAQSLVGLLRVPITGPGTLNTGEREMLESIIANPTTLFSLDSVNKAKLDKLEKKLSTAIRSSAETRGLSYDPASELPPEQQQWYRWAKANPSDPKAKAFFKKYGLE